MNIKTCYHRILGIIGSVFDAYSAVLIVPDKTGREYHIVSGFSLGDMLDYKAMFTPGKGLVGWIIGNNEPMLVNDFDTRQYHLGYYTKNEESRIKAFMGVPLRNGTGVICLDSKRQYSFSGKDQRILQLFADLVYEMQASSCVMEERVNLAKHHNALELIYGLRKRNRNWSAFLEQFLTLMAETTGFEYCSFSARDEEGQNYYLDAENQPLFPAVQEQGVPIASGLVGWVFKNGSPVFKDGEGAGASSLYGKDAQAPEFASVMCLPLVINRIPRGVLSFGSETPRVISEEMKTFCQMASEHLELFLENLYLRSRLHETGQKLRQLENNEAGETGHDTPHDQPITHQEESV